MNQITPIDRISWNKYARFWSLRLVCCFWGNYPKTPFQCEEIILNPWSALASRSKSHLSSTKFRPNCPNSFFQFFSVILIEKQKSKLSDMLGGGKYCVLNSWCGFMLSFTLRSIFRYFLYRNCIWNTCYFGNCWNVGRKQDLPYNDTPYVGGSNELSIVCSV